jgi:ferrous iron transport protein B
MELPPYRVPTLKGAVIHMWERGSIFIKKAGTIIFSVAVLVWALGSVPIGVQYASRDSVIGTIGSIISPVFAPVGFSNWQSSVALVFGFLAKEVVVGTLGTIMGAGNVETAGGHASLIASLHTFFTPLSAYAFLVFVLLYVPCVATVAIIRREIGGRWAAFGVAYQLVVAWIGAFVVYQGGLLLGFR